MKNTLKQDDYCTAREILDACDNLPAGEYRDTTWCHFIEALANQRRMTVLEVREALRAHDETLIPLWEAPRPVVGARVEAGIVVWVQPLAARDDLEDPVVEVKRADGSYFHRPWSEVTSATFK